MIELDGQRAFILWDVDHTLIETRGVGAELYRAAFREAVGVDLTEPADVTGATEPQIFNESMRINGLNVKDGDSDRYAVALARQYDISRTVLRERGRALPGAREAIAALKEMPGLTQSVLTGNLREVARTKLEVFELNTHLDLDVGAYGEDSSNRPELVSVAQLRVREKYGLTFTSSNTIVVGDSPSDVETGQKGGAIVIAVASGKSDPDELANLGANVVLRDLRDTAHVTRTVEGFLAGRRSS